MNHHSVWDIKVEIFHAYKRKRDELLEHILRSYLKLLATHYCNKKLEVATIRKQP